MLNLDLTDAHWREFCPRVKGDHEATLRKTVEFRKALIEECADNENTRRQVREFCRRDLLFYCSTFLWVMEPRGSVRLQPFVPWDFQCDTMRWIQEGANIGKPRLIKKSRDVGATVMCLAVIEHLWHFHPMIHALLVSRKEEFVEKAGHQKALFSKLDVFHQYQPRWLWPTGYNPSDSLCRQSKMMRNPALEGAITGESTNPDTGRGDRPAIAMLDEFASFDDGFSALNSISAATDCVIFNSTSKGAGTAFYRMQELLPATCKRWLPWHVHPLKSAGLYRGQPGGAVEMLNPMSPTPPGYRHQCDGRIRSPKYDEKCAMFPPAVIAQEEDGDDLGAGSPVFDLQLLGELEREAMDPFSAGELRFNPETLDPIEFVPGLEGRLRLWCMLDPRTMRPDEDADYVMGIDIAAGTGASNSAVVVLNRHTGAQVAEYADPRIRPHNFARFCVALARWFRSGVDGPAFMIWEANGHGRSFGTEVVESGFRRFYFRTKGRKLVEEVTDEPGWWSAKESKKALLVDANQALFERRLVVRSREWFGEAGRYCHNSTGGVDFSGATDNDPSGAGENHGDRVIAGALCVLVVAGRSVSEQPELLREADAPLGSFRWRQERYAAEHKVQAPNQFIW